MLYLIASIILTSWLTLCFKVVERFRLDNLQVIVFNYITCVITGCFINHSFPVSRQTIQAPWFPWAIVMGLIFVSLFNLVAVTTQKLGVAVASVAYKLSLVIPFVVSIHLYNEPNTTLKMAGIGLALIAVVMTCYKKPGQTGAAKHGLAIWVLPVILFIGSGLLDSMIKYVEHRFLDGTNNNDYLITAFLSAATAGAITLAIVVLRNKQRLQWKSVIAGISVGIPNYLSIWCLMNVLQRFSENSSAVIPINNMGIVLFSAVVAYIFFRERLSLLNWVGVLLSLVAIALIAFG